MKLRLLSFLCLAAVAASCVDRKEDVKSEKLFELLPSSKTHIDFENHLENKRLNILDYLYYYNGGGVASGDINNDGLADVYFTSNEGLNRLYLNKGNLVFEDITEAAKVSSEGEWSTGVTMMDINNDGYLDIYVCVVSQYKGLTGHNRLYINNKDLTFTERSEEYGLDFSGLSTHAAFFDPDNDGDLDMYLLNHSVHSTRTYGRASLRNEKDSIAGDRLYINQSTGEQPKFVDATTASGIYSSPIGYGLGIAISDVNQDGWSDIYVSNDFHENDYLYINQQNGTFRESLEKWISHTSRYSMGNDIADIDGDGHPDIMTVDMLPADPAILMKSAAEDPQEISDIKREFGYAPQYVRNCLQINQKDHFVEVAQITGVAATDWSWGPLLCDLDNDSRTDIFISNGIYRRPNDLDYIQYIANAARTRNPSQLPDSVDAAIIRNMPKLVIPNYVFRNEGGLKFNDQGIAWGLEEASCSNGAVYCDLDNDGDLDLVINNINQKCFVYENHLERMDKNNFLQVSLQGPAKNSFGIGATVKVYSNGEAMVKEMNLSRGFMSSVAPVLTFGIGKAPKVDSVVVRWKADEEQVVRNPEVNKKLLVKWDGTGHKNVSDQTSGPVVHYEDKPLPFVHAENGFKDYTYDVLIPYMLSREGPAVAIGDVNGDGLDDIYAGASRIAGGAIYIQDSKKGFHQVANPDIAKDYFYEDVDAVFFDANGDGFVDLYAATGGSEAFEGNAQLKDRLYFGDGKGRFKSANASLPDNALNGSCVRPEDFDGDGDIDLFVGSRSVPGTYGVVPESLLLKNDGKGSFTVYQTLKAGMISDASWFDYTRDGKPDLVLAGDWMPLVVYENINGNLQKFEGQTGLENTDGWWRCVTIADVNKDGLQDIIAGNVGRNLKFSPTKDKPATLYLNDFDDNGKSDPVMFYSVGDRQIPFATKMQLARQMPFVNKKFTSYANFSKVTNVNDVLPEAKIKSASVFNAYDFGTKVFLNSGNNIFRSVELPLPVQFTTVNDASVFDFNGDGAEDILFAGNSFSNVMNLSNADGQSKFMLLGSTDGKFTFQSLGSQGDFSNEYSRIIKLRTKNSPAMILVRRNGRSELISWQQKVAK